MEATASHTTDSTSFATAPASQNTERHETDDSAIPAVDLSILPPAFVLGTHLEEDELHSLERGLIDAGAPLTYDVHEARLFLGKVEQKMRAKLELKLQGLWTEDAPKYVSPSGSSKRRRLNGAGSRTEPIDLDGFDKSNTESEGGFARDSPQALHKSDDAVNCSFDSPQLEQSFSAIDFADKIKVVKLAWLSDTLSAGKPLPLQNYLVYEAVPVDARRSPKAVQSSTPPARPSGTDLKIRRYNTSPERPSASIPRNAPVNSSPTDNIMARAQLDAPPPEPRHTRGFRRSKFQRSPDPAFSHHGFSSSTQPQSHNQHRSSRPPLLQRETTSENESSRGSSPVPPPPDWVRENLVFACQRATPMVPVNNAFIAQLKQIRLARNLTGDEIGVRAYSTAIAAVSAYPNKIRHVREITQLPGCDNKIGVLWSEWRSKARECVRDGGEEDDAKLAAVEEFEDDEQMKVLRLFYEIWGVGAQTARDFYGRGWRDLDDIVMHGWKALTRVQQIGLKYYEEFQSKIPRAEVESIVEIIMEHTRKVRRQHTDGFQSCIVGGYRRGKTESGDVDVILTHKDEALTLGLVTDIVASLMDAGWVTHELVTHTSGTKRDQATLPFRSGGGGHGFDSLDKSLCVWQDPDFEAKPSEDGKIRNPNVHRRVDIIIAPWSKIGCAVLGWTADTTFERDLRRYARKVKFWKFDSSGVRDRLSGNEIDLEGNGSAVTIEEAERRVFEGFGLEWREPWERCTG